MLGFLQREVFDGVFRHFDRTAPVFYSCLREENTFTFAWISACVAHYLAKDGPVAFMPLILLLLLAVSYVTRPPSRQWATKVTTA